MPSYRNKVQYVSWSTNTVHRLLMPHLSHFRRCEPLHPPSYNTHIVHIIHNTILDRECNRGRGFVCLTRPSLPLQHGPPRCYLSACSYKVGSLPMLGSLWCYNWANSAPSCSLCWPRLLFSQFILSWQKHFSFNLTTGSPGNCLGDVSATALSLTVLLHVFVAWTKLECMWEWAPGKGQL